MTEPIKIVVPQCDTKNRTVKEREGHNITLTETYFRIQGWYEADVYDEDLGMKVKKMWDYDEILLKSSIVSLTLSYVDSEECYNVEMVSAQDAEQGVNFSDKESAQEFFDQLLKWWNP